ncbi:MAG: hypothetical protein QM783_15645 [Phycisphaerales bacterium]
MGDGELAVPLGHLLADQLKDVPLGHHGDRVLHLVAGDAEDGRCGRGLGARARAGVAGGLTGLAAAAGALAVGPAATGLEAPTATALVPATALVVATVGVAGGVAEELGDPA